MKRAFLLPAALLAMAAMFLPALSQAQVPGMPKPPKQPAEKAAPKLPDPLTKEAIRELTARLTDTEVRQLLIQQLDRAAAPAKAAPDDMSGMILSMGKESQVVRERMDVLLQAAVDFPGTLQDAYEKFQEGREPGHFLKVSLACALGFAFAWFAELLYRRGMRAHRIRLDERHDEGFAAQSARNLLRFLLDLGDLAVFAIAVLAAFYALYQGHEQSRLFVLTVIGAVVAFRLVALTSRFLLEPDAPALRLLPLDDRGARRLHSGILQMAAVHLTGVSFMFLLDRLGAPAASAAVLIVFMGTLLLVLAIATIWAIRHHIGSLMLGKDGGGPLTRLFAELWPLLASAYLLVVYATIVMDVLDGQPPEGRGILSVLLLVALPIADLVLGRMLHAAVAKRADGKTRQAGLSYEPVLRKALHIVVVVVGMLLLAQLWNISFINMAERGLGERLAGELLGIAIVLLLAYLLSALGGTALERLTEQEGGLPAGANGDEGSTVVATRLATLLPLIRGTLHGTVIVMTVLGVLSALGINILPLLAGASVVGVAIAFGAQTLVRDIVSGAFFLADDAFRVGEYIEVGESKGTVEKIKIRSLFLRHHRGAINILPYGEIRRLRNQSRDWVIDKMTIGITYDSDLEKARKLIKKIGQELADNPEYASKVIEPLKMQGVEQFGDFAIQIRMKMKTLPNEQFVIRRKAYAMIKKAFDENGIKFAFPTVQVAGGGEASVAAAAAASQVQPHS